MSILQATQIEKTYHMGDVTVHALAGADFTVHKSEFVAVMGPSGSGKSTLLHLLGGLDLPTAGEIKLAGQALSELNDDTLTILRRRKVGFIFQFFNLLPTLSTEENIALPLLIDGHDLRMHQSKINHLLDLVGLSDRKDHKPNQLSGGQQQRVAIARALVTDPEIILADEPTGNLDSKTGDAILGLMRRACDEMQATIVMVSHDPRAASYADRIVFLKDGCIVGTLQNDTADRDVQPIMDMMARLDL